MKKIKIKDIYLILVIVVGLIVISLYSTYALFTSEEITTNTAVNMSVGFSYGYATNEVEFITLNAKESKEISVSISNTSSSSINYNLYYELVSGDEASLEAGYTSNTENPTNGVLDASSSKRVMLGFINNSDSDITVKIGFTTDSIVSPRKELNNEVILNKNLDTSGANAPSLADGMIPIMWNGTNWVKADVTNQDENYRWYNYDEKQWANAVMVNATSRDNYMNADEGTTITEDDVLAYYVWIPRYKYQLFNVNSEKMDPILIDVQFESKTTAKSTGSSNGEYLTHPAFTFGTTELDGIWVGKFETTGSATTPTIKPNVTSLTSQNVSTKFTTGQKFGTSNYLTTTGVSQVDAHMMKNTEWGAVAYLKQSKYGLGLTDIALNSNDSNDSYLSDSYLTGCGPQSAGSTSYGSTCNAYNTDLGKSASTTGNITGIYDMSGGAKEDVMGVMKTSDGTALFYSNSGFTTSTLPFNSKYVDQYEYDQTEYNAIRILGDATGETKGWYSDYFEFPYIGAPWFERGGYASDASLAGVFCAYGVDGSADTSISFRSVLALGA